jgi:membrane fusion protein, protease secretion system
MNRRLIEAAKQIVAKIQAGGAKVDTWAEKSTLNHADKNRDVHFYNRVGWRVLIFGFGGFILWASLAPIDRGVTASGWVITDGQRKVVQPLGAGIVEEIYVGEGDQVKAGQLLVKLNQVNAVAGLGITQGSVTGLEAQIAALESGIQQKKTQLANIESLVKEGYMPRNRALELRGVIATDEANLQGLKKELVSQRERLAPASQELSNTELRAPVDGYVVNLQVFTKGGVVSPGAKLLEVVPIDQPLVVEAQLPVHLIDKVHEGQVVEMLFTAFNQNRTPHIPGEVTVVGDDRIVDERTGAPYFKLLAQATPEGKKMLEGLKVRPGMPVDVFVKTGERTMMSYLLKPLLDRMHSSMRED